MGMPGNPNLLIYGTGGLGLIGGTTVFGFGAGGEFGLGNGMALDLSAIVRAPLGFAPTEFGTRATLLMRDIPLDTHKDWLPLPFERLLDVELGANWIHPNDLDVSAAVHLPSFAASDFALFDEALRASAGVQLSTGSPEFFGGLQLGLQVAPTFQVYGFGDLGLIGSTPVNAVGVGGSLRLAPGVLKPEAFTRGPVGTLTEGGLRIGLFADATCSCIRSGIRQGS